MQAAMQLRQEDKHRLSRWLGALPREVLAGRNIRPLTAMLPIMARKVRPFPQLLDLLSRNVCRFPASKSSQLFCLPPADSVAHRLYLPSDTETQSHACTFQRQLYAGLAAQWYAQHSHVRSGACQHLALSAC